MARIRSLKPEVWMSPQVMNLEFGSRLLFIGLITQADDQGRGIGDARRLKAAVFPADDVTAATVEGWLKVLEAEGLVILYDVEVHGRLFQLVSWHTHQSINKPKPSNYPPPTGFVPDKDGSPTGGVPREGNGLEGSGMEGKGSGGTDVAVPGLDGLTWDRWIAYRIEIRKPLKPASIPAAQQKLAAYGRDQAAVVEQSIANGWQGLFELKRGSGTVPRETATQRIERALARREGRTFDA